MEIFNGQELSFYEVLYKAKCNVCGYELEWTANFDADGTDYNVRCCGKHYRMSPSMVKISIEDVVE